MKIALFNGGLGNQVFQYIFARFVEELSGQPVLLDDTYFFGEVDHNGYELEKVFPNSKPKLFSRQFSKDAFDAVISEAKAGKSLPTILNEGNNNFFMVAETGDYNFSGNLVKVAATTFSPYIAYTQGNVYYYGYWINKWWLYSNKEKMFKELAFIDISHQSLQNREYANKIKNTNSVAVHIRRGDFVKIGWAMDNEFYYDSIRSMSADLRNPTFFIFSDEIDWCRENAQELGMDFAKGNLVYVEGNYDKKNNYVDMQLMSMCKHMIISQSAFSYLAYLLNCNTNISIINPTTREI